MINNDLFLGPAFDEAAEWHERADAAMVWLLPQALPLIADPGELWFMKWQVPLKGMGLLSTKVLNPLACHIEAKDHPENVWGDIAGSTEQQLGNFLRPFDLARNPMDVALKRQATEELLKTALEHSRQWFNRAEPGRTADQGKALKASARRVLKRVPPKGGKRG